MTTDLINTLVAQFPITLDIRQNLDVILSFIIQAKPETLIILPEGALSGYTEDPAFLGCIDLPLLEASLQRLCEGVIRQSVHLILGSCLFEGGCWYNTGLYLSPRREMFVYRKINLATHERGAFTPGDALPVLETEIGGRKTMIGIQLCREIRFPEQWQHLARAGAEIFTYLTNAVGNAADAPVWRSHLISRAAENQRFVLAANVSHPAQKCPSMIVTPGGGVIWETLSPALETGHAALDLSQVSNWYLSQARLDVMKWR